MKGHCWCMGLVGIGSHFWVIFSQIFFCSDLKNETSLLVLKIWRKIWGRYSSPFLPCLGKKKSFIRESLPQLTRRFFPHRNFFCYLNRVETGKNTALTIFRIKYVAALMFYFSIDSLLFFCKFRPKKRPQERPLAYTSGDVSSTFFCFFFQNVI